MSKYVLNLTGRDWAKASPGDPNACLLAVGLSRDLGGTWSVAGNHATEFGRDGETIKRQLRLGSDAKSVMRWFDWLGVKTGSKVTLYGNAGQPRAKGKRKQAAPVKHHAPLSMGQKGAVGSAGAGGVLVLTGFWWIDAIVLAVIAVTMAGTIAVRRGVIPAPHPAPARVRRSQPELPSWRQLRGMAPQERGAAYRGAVAAPAVAVPEPERVQAPAAPVPLPPVPRPSWPVSAPREVDGVSHAPLIPDHVPDNLAQREQARAADRS